MNELNRLHIGLRGVDLASQRGSPFILPTSGSLLNAETTTVQHDGGCHVNNKRSARRPHLYTTNSLRLTRNFFLLKCDVHGDQRRSDVVVDGGLR